MKMKFFFTLLAFVFTISANAQTLSPLSINGDKIVDASGKTVILRGCVTITHDGPSSPVIYTANDYKRLKAWGANYQSIRLFAANIGATGTVGLIALNNFLVVLDTMVARAKTQGIYTEFKLTMYGTAGFEWDSVWNDNNGEQNQIITGWKNIWNRYKTEPAVIGYDLLNEPGRGIISETVFVCAHLNLLYQKIIDSLQVIDSSKMALIQSAVHSVLGQINSYPYSCPIAKSNVIYAPHFYVNILYPADPNDTSGYAERISQYKAEAVMHNSPLLIGEYGVPWNAANDSIAIKKAQYVVTETAALTLFDSLKIGFSRPWFSDDKAKVTNDINWALISDTSGLAGPERKFIFDIISRPYPQKTAGTLLSTKYYDASKKATIKYLPNPAFGSTTIFIPRKRHFNDSLVIQYNNLVLFVDTITNSLIPLCNPDNYNLANFTWNNNAEILTVNEWQSITATVSIKGSNLCSTSTGLKNDSNAAVFNVYPNPSNGKFNLVIAGKDVSLSLSKGQLEIYNRIGEKVWFFAIYSG